MPDAIEAAGKPYDYVVSRAHTPSKSGRNIDPPEGSPTVNFRMVMVLRSEELDKTAYMGVQPTHGTVQDSHSSRS